MSHIFHLTHFEKKRNLNVSTVHLPSLSFWLWQTKQTKTNQCSWRQPLGRICFACIGRVESEIVPPPPAFLSFFHSSSSPTISQPRLSLARAKKHPQSLKAFPLLDLVERICINYRLVPFQKQICQASNLKLITKGNSKNNDDLSVTLITSLPLPEKFSFCSTRRTAAGRGKYQSYISEQSKISLIINVYVHICFLPCPHGSFVRLQ